MGLHKSANEPLVRVFRGGGGGGGEEVSCRIFDSTLPKLIEGPDFVILAVFKESNHHIEL